jgi:cytochrome c-type biogenesis protein CcmH
MLPASSLRRWAHTCGILLLATFLLGAGDEAARFDQLGHNMICGCGCRQILLECNHVGCQVSDKMVRELRVALTRGDSDDLVMQAFVQRYGETVRAAPEAKGFNLMAWITPFAMLLAGLLVAVAVLRRWSLRPEAVAAAPGAPSPQLEALRQKARQETEL